MSEAEVHGRGWTWKLDAGIIKPGASCGGGGMRISWGIIFCLAASAVAAPFTNLNFESAPVADGTSPTWDMAAQQAFPGWICRYGTNLAYPYWVPPYDTPPPTNQADSLVNYEGLTLYHYANLTLCATGGEGGAAYTEPIRGRFSAFLRCGVGGSPLPDLSVSISQTGRVPLCTQSIRLESTEPGCHLMAFVDDTLVSLTAISTSAGIVTFEGDMGSYAGQDVVLTIMATNHYTGDTVNAATIDSIGFYPKESDLNTNWATFTNMVISPTSVFVQVTGVSTTRYNFAEMFYFNQTSDEWRIREVFLSDTEIYETTFPLVSNQMFRMREEE